MSEQPDILTIARGRPWAAIRAFACQLMPMLCPLLVTVTQLNAHGLNFVNCCLVFYCLCLPWAVATQCRAFKAAFDAGGPYVTMDSTGLTCSLPTLTARSWSQIEACACKSDRYRTVLRVFLKGRLRRSVDIDFALAAQPKKSLDEALAACASWITATRDPSAKESPIREYSDGQSRPAMGRYVTLVIVLSLIAVGAISAVTEMRHATAERLQRITVPQSR